jgi:hypothetical protein
VQDQQVDLFDAELGGAFLERVERRVVAAVADPDLRLEEDVGAVDPRAPDAFPDLAFVAVAGCRVDVPVADAQRLMDGGDRLFRRSLEDAVAECRQVDAVVQRQGRDRG